MRCEACKKGELELLTERFAVTEGPPARDDPESNEHMQLYVCSNPECGILAVRRG